MEEDKKSYKKTLNLPKTGFGMRANLLQKEPAIQDTWKQQDLYGKVREARAGGRRFILHDGPPYANGNIHIGHTLNKVLKDMVVRIANMTGMDAPYIPGWDCHGLPIEQKVMDQLGETARDLAPIKIRNKCRKYAEKFVKIQSKQFQRLGVMGEFDAPYITMSPAYEASVVDVFSQLVERGLVFRQLKPVHWSIEHRTALADAELEYRDRDDSSIYVAFEVERGADAVPHGDGERVFLCVWTTTPWTLPANRAVAVRPDFEYAAVRVTTPAGPAVLVVAAELLERVGGECPEWFSGHDVIDTFPGSILVDGGITYAHPVADGISCPVIPAGFVTLEDGTGLVHAAPGHGTEDYYAGLEHDLDIYCPVREDGTFDESVPAFLRGLSVWEANPRVVEHLKSKNTLVAEHRISHSYPHDWRSKGPTIFRATEQWFIGVDRPLDGAAGGPTLRQMAVDYCSKPAAEGGVDFVPAWGRNRILGMIENRPDWCISRQRAWGLPIPAFFNGDGKVLCTPASTRAVADTFRTYGSDGWFTRPAADLLGAYDPAADPDLDDPVAFAVDNLTPGGDIFDVWFESGGSWAAVAIQRGLVDDVPVDLYLEGSDQHRGWFQLSLLPALGAKGAPPFRTVLTHGFINDAAGRKMSKSLGNVVDVQDQLKKRGADILRLWVASQDYQDDDRCSEDLIAQCEDTYRKLRNTLKFCLGSIDDFDPAGGAAPGELSLDRWMRMELHRLIDAVRGAYDDYEFHRALRLLYGFCVNQASSVYLSAVKDRLYCELPDSPRRRSAQAVIRETLVALVKLMAPIIPHTCEEAWGHMPLKPDDGEESVHLAFLPEPDAELLGAATEEPPANPADILKSPDDALAAPQNWIWQQVMAVRSEALAELERLKDEGVKNSLDTELVLTVPASMAGMKALFEKCLPDIEDLAGVGYVRIEEGGGPDTVTPTVTIADTREKYGVCARCWKRRPDVGSDPAFPDVSARDAAVLKQLNETA